MDTENNNLYLANTTNQKTEPAHSEDVNTAQNEEKPWYKRFHSFFLLLTLSPIYIPISVVISFFLTILLLSIYQFFIPSTHGNFLDGFTFAAFTVAGTIGLSIITAPVIGIILSRSVSKTSKHSIKVLIVTGILAVIYFGSLQISNSQENQRYSAAIANQDLAACRTFEEKQNACEIAILTTISDISICKSPENGYIQSRCFNKVAVNTANPNVCFEYSGPKNTLTKKCISNYARETQDKRICNLLKDNKEDRIECFFHVDPNHQLECAPGEMVSFNNVRKCVPKPEEFSNSKLFENDHNSDTFNITIGTFDGITIEITGTEMFTANKTYYNMFLVFSGTDECLNSFVSCTVNPSGFVLKSSENEFANEIIKGNLPDKDRKFLPGEQLTGMVTFFPDKEYKSFVTTYTSPSGETSEDIVLDEK